MDNKSTTKRMIGAVVLVLIAALLLAWLLKGKNQSVQQQQELIADQTNQGGSTPILGFPGVQEGEEVAQEGDAPYVIGGADAQQDGTTTEQAAPATDQQQVADAGKADDATGTGVGAAVGGAAAGAVTAGKEAVQTLANNFQVRDSDEQRQVVADGKAKAGTGSMGSSELALPKQGETAATTTDAATATTAAGGDANQQQAQTADATKAPAAPAKQAQSAGTGDSAAQDKQAAESQKAAANVKLVGEKTVPAPRSQSSNTASSSSSGSRTAATTSASRSSAAGSSSQSVAGGKGYAIQVLAASSLNKAEQVRKSISVDGYPVFVVKASVNGKTVYRVRVGTYPARNAASAVQTKMKARYTKNQYVQNSFVTKN